jgi:hypothetical protein
MWSVLIVVALAAIVGLFMPRHRDRTPAQPQPPPAAAAAVTIAASPAAAPSPARGRTRATWLEVLALGAAALIAMGAAARPHRRRAGAEFDDTLATLVDDSLEGLRAEPDPRKAVIAAYARMERGLGGSGLARAASETALEYLGRVLADRRVSPAAVIRLTNLFERAKFSDHAIGADAKQDAIAALDAVRDELRAGPTARAQAGAGAVAP